MTTTIKMAIPMAMAIVVIVMAMVIVMVLNYQNLEIRVRKKLPVIYFPSSDHQRALFSQPVTSAFFKITDCSCRLHKLQVWTAGLPGDLTLPSRKNRDSSACALKAAFVSTFLEVLFCAHSD